MNFGANLTIKINKNKLPEFHKKLSKLKFLDPACGCGNFLVITYRELRLLEVEILRAMNKNGQGFLDVRDIIWLDVDMMCGIEYEEFPARIAEVAMWLMDHQMNMAISNEFGQYFARLPLKKAANIVHGNALQMEWENIVPQNELSYILGNPPFIGKQLQNSNQKKDMEVVFRNYDSGGALDYVTAWYVKAAKYIKDTKIKAAFVSTNSISQGEQVSMLWGIFYSIYKIKIHFAHQSFKWSNEAKGNAGVHVVIIGFANFDINEKNIFEYENILGLPHELKVKNINPYLVEGKDQFVIRRKQPISKVPLLIKGNQPTDDGNFLFTNEEMEKFVNEEPNSKKWFKRFIGSNEFINNIERWCLWLVDISPTELKQLPRICERVNNVKNYRLKSPKASTNRKAQTPTLFDEIRHTGNNYLVIPEVSSENRKYLPIGYIDSDIISSNKNYMLPNALLYHFGILNSMMHNVWTQNVSGRLESRIQYSNGIVYNNYPWPENHTEKHFKIIETAAQKILNTRLLFPYSSLADLYDPISMPPALVKVPQ